MVRRVSGLRRMLVAPSTAQVSSNGQRSLHHVARVASRAQAVRATMPAMSLLPGSRSFATQAQGTPAV